jgi:putative two-component system response regulator
VADVFDALTNARPYKRPLSLEASLDIILAERGTHFDPRVVDAFFSGVDQIIRVYCEERDDADGSECCAPQPAPVLSAGSALVAG